MARKHMALVLESIGVANNVASSPDPTAQEFGAGYETNKNAVFVTLVGLAKRWSQSGF